MNTLFLLEWIYLYSIRPNVVPLHEQREGGAVYRRGVNVKGHRTMKRCRMRFLFFMAHFANALI